MTLLPGAPWLLAHRSMLKVNQPMKVSLYGSDYVMWKDAAGTITALPNACPHMGAMLSEGWCQPQENGTSAIVCPFHALEFDQMGCTTLPGSKKKTLSQIQPLALVIQGDFIWTYGGYEPKLPIPTDLNQISENYEFVGFTADVSLETDLLSMLLIMHDYNHQNGTHRDLFQITEVLFEKFIDQGHYSEAFFTTPTAPYSLFEKLKNPSLFLLPDVIKAHLENFFPSIVVLHVENAFGVVAQCHVFIPEAENRTRTYVLMFAQAKNLLFRPIGKTFLNFSRVVIEQDAEILGKIYPNTPQKIKLNNEVGMDWVRRNFENFPAIVEPNLSRS